MISTANRSTITVQGAERIRTAVSGLGTLYTYPFRAARREAAQARKGAGS